MFDQIGMFRTREIKSAFLPPLEFKTKTSKISSNFRVPVGYFSMQDDIFTYRLATVFLKLQEKYADRPSSFFSYLRDRRYSITISEIRPLK